MLRQFNKEKAEVGRKCDRKNLAKLVTPFALALAFAGCGEPRQQETNSYETLSPVAPVRIKTPTQYANDRVKILAQNIVDLSRDPEAKKLSDSKRRLVFGLPLAPINPTRQFSKEQQFGISASAVKPNGDPDTAKVKHLWINSGSLDTVDTVASTYLLDIRRDNTLGGLDFDVLYSRLPESKSPPKKLCYNTDIKEPLGGYLPADAGTIDRILQDASQILDQAENGLTPQPLFPPERLGSTAINHPGCR